MKTKTFITVFTLALPAVTGAGLGDVLASWEAPSPRHDFNGVACEGEYIWVKYKLPQSEDPRVIKCTKTGSVVTKITMPHPSPVFYSYGLTFDGEYLWTVYEYWHVPYHDSYWKYTTTGSYVGGFFGSGYDFGRRAIASDGEYIFTDTPNHKNAEKYTTTGTLVATFTMPVSFLSDMAYYKRQLWYYGYNGASLMYGVTLNGSVVASFPAPGGSCEGTAFDGEYLWTIDDNNPQYVYKVDIDVVGVAPASLGRVKALFR